MKRPEPLTISHDKEGERLFSAELVETQANLQAIVNCFNELETAELSADDFAGLISSPQTVYAKYLSLVVDKIHKADEVKLGRKVKREHVAQSVDLPSPSTLFQLVAGLGKTAPIELINFSTGKVLINTSQVVDYKEAHFKKVLTNPAKIALYHKFNELTSLLNSFSQEFSEAYPNKQELIRIVAGVPSEIRAFAFFKPDVSTGKVLPILDLID